MGFGICGIFIVFAVVRVYAYQLTEKDTWKYTDTTLYSVKCHT